MKRALGVACVLACCCLAADRRPTSRPGVKRTVPQLIDALRSEDAEARMLAAWDLGRAGPKAEAAVPALVRALTCEHFYVRGNAAWALGRIGPGARAAIGRLVESLKDTDAGVALCACEALAKIGPAAVPALKGALWAKARPPVGGIRPFARPASQGGKPDARELAAFALARIGGPAIDVLIEGLRSDDEQLTSTCAKALAQAGPAAVGPLAAVLKQGTPPQRRLAAQSLAGLGPAAGAAVADLAGALKDADARVRSLAAAALGRIGPGARSAVPALIETARSGEESLRVEAIWSLGSIGPDARAAIPMLAEVLRGDSKFLSGVAARSLGEIGSAAAVPLARALKDGPQTRRADVARALFEMGPAAKAAVPVLVEVLRDGPEDAQLPAAEIVAQIGPAAREAAPHLVKLLPGEALGIADLEKGAGRALVRIGADAAGVLTEALKAGDPKRRGAIIFVLGRIGPAAKPAALSIIRALDDDSDLGWTACAALRRIGIDDPKAISALAKLLGRLSIGDAVADLLGRTGKPAVPACIQALKSGGVDARCGAAEALGAMGPAAAPAVEPLADMLGRRRVSDRAVGAMARIGKASVPALVRALGRQSWHVRRDAVRALGRIEPAPPEALAALQRALSDSDYHVRDDAAWGLARMGPAARSAVPMLLRVLDRRDNMTDEPVLAALGRVDPEGKVLDEKRLSALRAHDRSSSARIFALGRLAKARKRPEEKAAVFLPALRDAEPDVRAYAAKSLGEIGPAARSAVPELIRLVKHEKKGDIVMQGVIALGRIGPAAAEAVPALIAALREYAPLEAAKALGNIGARAERVVPALLEVLKRIYTDEGSIPIFEGLGKFGPAAKAAVPVLIRGLEGGLGNRKPSAAARALVRIGADAAPAVLAVYEDPGHYEFRRRDAVRILAMMGPAAKSAVPALIRAARKPDWEAVRALGEIGPAARDAIPVLAKLAKKEYEVAQRALAKIRQQPSLPLVLFDLVLAVERGNAAAYRAAWEDLQEIRPDVKSKAQGLILALEHDNSDTRRLAARHLPAAKPPPARGVPALVRALKNAEYHHDAYCRALGSFGPAAKGAVPALIAVAGDRSVPRHLAGRSREACNALGRIGPAARDAVPALRRHLAGRLAWRDLPPGAAPHIDPDAGHTYCAAIALARILPGVKQAAPDIPERVVRVLTRTLRWAKPHHAECPGPDVAAEALGLLGPAARDALPVLTEIVQPQDDESRVRDDRLPKRLLAERRRLRQAAAEAIRKIRRGSGAGE